MKKILLVLFMLCFISGVSYGATTEAEVDSLAKTKYLVVIDSGSGTSSWQDGARTSFEAGEVIRVEKYKDQKKADMSRSELNNIVVIMDLTKDQLDMLQEKVLEDEFDEATGDLKGKKVKEPRKYKIDISKLQANEFVEESDVETIINSLIIE